MQFKKGSKETDYMKVLSQLKPGEVMTDFVFKDRLFASLSNYAAAVCSHEQGGISGVGGVAPANPLGQVTMW
jgi:hypothetical protein